MTSKKKLSLQEFYQDNSFGDGSWADDDFDPSSISVPLMSQRPHHDSFGHHQSHFGNMPPRGGPPQGHFGGHPAPGGPPYIVKLSNVPAYFGNEHISELFESRFTKFVKFKLFWEVDQEALRMSANQADALNKRKKVAFVEVASTDFDKVLRWTDVYLENGFGKLRIDAANFDDFRMHMDINQSVQETDDPSLSLAKRRTSNAGRSPLQQPTLLHRQLPAPHAISNNNVYQLQQQRPIRDHPLPPLHPASPAPPPKKSNPFGNARPVDTLSKQLELEKKLQYLEINSTTFRTLGHQQESKQVEQKKPESIQKPSSPQQKKPSPPSPRKQSPIPVAPAAPQFKPALQPVISAWGTPTADPTFSQVASPPKHPLGLNIEGGSPSPSFSKKKSSTPEDVTKTVVLKRKHAEPRKSRIASPEVKEVPKEVEKKSVAKKELLKKDVSLDSRLDDEFKKGNCKEEAKPFENKREKPKRERPVRERPKKEDSRPADYKQLPAEDPKDSTIVRLTAEEKEALRREKRRERDLARREKKKAERANAKSGSNSTENTPEAKAPGPSESNSKSMKKNDSKESIQEDQQPGPNPMKKDSNKEKPTKKTEPREVTKEERKVTGEPAENTDASRPKPKRGRGGSRGGRGGSRASTRDSSVSPDKPVEKPPASAPSRATGVNAIVIDGSHSEDRPLTSRGRGGSRGRGSRGRGRGQKVFYNLTQTYNHTSESQPE